MLALATQALESLPSQFRDRTGHVRLLVEDMADDATLDGLGIDNGYELTGLYEGRPEPDAANVATGELPPVVRLFRLPILLEWIESGEELGHLVRHVLIHEIGHHFGLSDDDIDAIEAEAVPV